MTLEQRIAALAQAVGVDIKALLDRVRSGLVDPEGNVNATPGKLYLRDSGQVYKKATGAGNTGWVELTTGAVPPPTDVPFLLGSRFQMLDEGTETGLTTGRTSRIIHVCAGGTQLVRVLYANWRGDNTEPSTGNAIFVKAGVEVGATIYPLLFSGQQEVQIADGGDVWTDWTAVPIAAGQTFYTRSFVRVATAGQLTPRGIVAYAPEWIADGLDQTYSGTTVSRVGNYTFAPIAAQGQGVKKSGVVIYGDSIPTGAADGAGHDYGYVTRGLAGRIGAINCAKGNASAQDLPTAGKRVALAQYGTHALYAFGANDVSNVQTFTTVRDRMQARIDALTAQGLKVVMVTLPPRSQRIGNTGTWAVSNQQQINANFNAGGLWWQLQDWIRCVPPNVYAVLDVTEPWANDRDSFFWHPDRVADGIHPNTRGHDHAKGLVVDAVTTGVFS